ncbi:glycosyl transferase [Mycoplasmopsis californica HAZ160_1]|uniref:Glycosyl transferase n=2 Tax=Mycoplasmopsis californica TaxID=2113 RepID=A0A059XRF7_9BACT|nr:glycosyltransferase [Mycoplasmopsis californica]AIA29368.1 glycosyl transferase [Mycoplasmopsis californica]BAP01178.1 glycosyl transferase [Mycoplasmopsis californica HAZ160_1]BBG41046.1 glycosyl transferase [Mycoplasmopsis californica]BBG41639.1 glycosyl transferase [Mycoplasmopsis californica]BBG42233.1 glycosyl transferase [Mycoplasmopsis californica]
MNKNKLVRTKADLHELSKRPLRVLMFGDTFLPRVDGSVRVMQNYAEQFKDKNVELLILAPQYLDYNNALDKELKYSVLRVKSTRVMWTKTVLIKSPLSKETLKKIDDFSPDIIHSHTPISAGTIGKMLSARYNVPLIFTMHNIFKIAIAKSMNSELIGQIGGQMASLYINSSHRIFHVSQHGMNEYASDLTNRHVLIGNGTKFKYPDNHLAIAQKAIDKFGIDIKKKNLLFVSRFVWEKNIKFLLDSFKILVDKDPSYSLTMAGGSGAYEEIVEYAKRIGVYQNIIFTNLIEEDILLQGLYLSHDLFIYPSVYDAFGMVVHEAAVHKLASLVIENSASSEGIEDSINGYVVKEDENSFASKIIEIFTNPTQLKQAGLNAQSLPSDWSKVVDKLIVEYFEALKSFYAEKRKKRMQKIGSKIRAKFSHR